MTTKRLRDPLASRRAVYALNHPAKPDRIHDYLPRREIGHDECRICGKVWNSANHIPLEADDL